jgi:hypothetical protein
MEDSKEFEIVVMNDVVKVVRYLGEKSHINIPEMFDGMSVIEVAAQAFSGKPLQTVVFPGSLRCLEMDALTGCDELVEISLPGSLSEIRGCIQCECPTLQTVRIEGSEISVGCLIGLSSLNGVQILQHYIKNGVEAWINIEMRAICG